MTPSQGSALAGAAKAIRRVAPRYPVERVGVFGSVARGDAGPGSDLDVVALFSPARTTRDVLLFCADLEDECGREVNLVTSLEGISAAFEGELRRDMVVAYER